MAKKISFIIGVVLFVSPLSFAQLGIFTDEISVGDDAWLGQASFDNGVYTIEASGSDIQGTADGMYFIWQEISGSFIIECDLAWGDQIEPAGAPDTGNDWKKMGPMIRALPADDAGAANILGLLRRDLAADLQWREDTGGETNNAGEQVKSGVETDTLRMVRMLDTVTLMRKQQDGSYRTVGSHTLDLEDPVAIGFAVTAHDTTHIAVAQFSNVSITEIPVAIMASRDLPKESFAPGVIIPGVQIEISVEEGESADLTVKETLPTGWEITNISDSGTLDGSVITWNLTGISGSETLSYDLRPASSAKEGVLISGSFEDANGTVFGITGDSGLDIEGASEAMAPKLDKSITLDGVIEEDEWADSYVFNFDRKNVTAPGVLINGPSFTNEESNLTVYVFHNDDYIYVGLDMVDPLLDYESYGNTANVWEYDSVELYVDGDLSQSNPKDGNEFGFQATVRGDGAFSAGNNPPTPIEMGPLQHYSEDGLYWNFGAKSKGEHLAEDSGFVVEYSVDKAMCLDPLDIEVVGFDVAVNDASNTGTRSGKWAWWHLNADTGGRMDSWNDERGWGTLQLLDGPLPPDVDVSDWTLY